MSLYRRSLALVLTTPKKQKIPYNKNTENTELALGKKNTQKHKTLLI